MADSYHSRATAPLYRGTRIVWYIVGVIEAILAFRFFLKMLGANPGAGFTEFIYGLTQPFVSPFLNVFGMTSIQGATFEWPTILAMVFYWFVGWAIIKLFFVSKPVSTAEAARKLNREDKSL